MDRQKDGGRGDGRTEAGGEAEKDGKKEEGMEGEMGEVLVGWMDG